ncbi:aspartate/glutamate racemase family protein [Taklimakanibacter lacteus]|uniref:aspartate/glutamate racemase family protein n=1 Tax=Taklimakanibacter lacteus TaxID=2268456 RepID=UPI000E66E352
MHIRLIVPVLDSEALVGKAEMEYRAFAAPGTTVSAVPLRRGTFSIEAEFDSALAAPEVMRLAREAEAEGVDACTIVCFTDPGLFGARELVSIPVIGEGEAALHAAAMLSSRFTVMITEEALFPLIRRVVARYGFSDKLACVKAAGARVLDLDESRLPHVIAQCSEAVERDGAEAVVMGCTGTGFDMASSVETALHERFGVHIPVIDPGKVAVKFAEAFAGAGLRHSKRAFPLPGSARSEYGFA